MDQNQKLRYHCPQGLMEFVSGSEEDLDILLKVL